MHILITGAAGMVGRKLSERLAAEGGLDGKPIDKLTLVDVVAPTPPAGFSGKTDAYALDVSQEDAGRTLANGRPDVIFHLAAVVSGEAETDFEKGYRSNLTGMQHLLEAIRTAGGYRPKLVFSSSIAVFGAPFPSEIHDEFHHTPLTSYGAQKAICELLLADYTRKGFLDGVGLRLPTICVRPGAPNKASSGFFSNIIREPLAGHEAVLPVEESVMHWHASPRSAVGFLTHAAALTRAQLGPRINLTMPGVACTVGEQIAALRRVAGERAVARIRREPDAAIMKIVSGWPTRFDARRARALGFVVEDSFDEIIRVHVDDELGGDDRGVGVPAASEKGRSAISRAPPRNEPADASVLSVLFECLHDEALRLAVEPLLAGRRTEVVGPALVRGLTRHVAARHRHSANRILCHLSLPRPRGRSSRTTRLGAAPVERGAHRLGHGRDERGHVALRVSRRTIHR